MVKFVREKLIELSKQRFVGMRCVGHNTWEVTINQDKTGCADYNNTEIADLKDKIRDKLLLIHNLQIDCEQRKEAKQ